MKTTIEHKIFHFKRPSGTSRGVLTEKHAWFLKIWDEANPNVIGLGECSVIPGLSPDFEDKNSYEHHLQEFCRQFEQETLTISKFNTPHLPDWFERLQDFPSILFGFETALLDLKNGGKGIVFDNDFHTGKRKIPINGLIWMGEKAFMQEQIEDKLKAGFSTIKMKIGAIDLATELDLLTSIRENYPPEKITLRVDANGAFTPKEAPAVLKKLVTLSIHSIEQPIKAGNWEAMASLCQNTPIPIALDEELIGINTTEEKQALLNTIQPQYIILKPSLHGGIFGCQEWIRLAEAQQIHWWITSALESNVGLNAICQFTATYQNELPQGLGTGSLYTNNVESDLIVEGGTILVKRT